MTTAVTRRQRFACSTASREFWPTDRVLSILRRLARFLTVDQLITRPDIEHRVHALSPVTRQKVSRLLRDLYRRRHS